MFIPPFGPGYIPPYPQDAADPEAIPSSPLSLRDDTDIFCSSPPTRQVSFNQFEEDYCALPPKQELYPLYIIPENLEWLKENGLATPIHKVKVEVTDDPSGEIDLSLLEQGSVRFLKSDYSTEWKKKAIVLSHLFHDPEDAYELEGLISSFLHAGFRVFFMGLQLVEIDDPFQMSHTFHRDCGLDEILKLASEKGIAFDELLWINWSNVREIIASLSPFKNPERPDLFDPEEGPIGNLKALYLDMNSALKILSSPDFHSAYTPPKTFPIELKPTEENLPDILKLLKRLPERTKVSLAGKSSRYYPLILQRLPLHCISELRIQSGKEFLCRLTEKEMILKAYEISQKKSDLKAFEKALKKLSKENAPIQATIDPRVAIITSPLGNSYNKVFCRDDLEEIWFHPSSIGEYFLDPRNISTAPPLFEILDLIGKNSPRLKRLSIEHFEPQEKSSRTPVSHFYLHLISYLSKMYFPCLTELKLANLTLNGVELLTLLENCPQILVLELERIHNKDEGLPYHATAQLPTRLLKIVNSGIEDPLKTALFKMMPDLKALIVPKMAYSVIPGIRFRWLEVIDIEVVREEHIKYFLRDFPMVKHWRCSNCSNRRSIHPFIYQRDPEKPPLPSELELNFNTGVQGYTLTPTFQGATYGSDREALYSISFSEGKVSKTPLTANFTPFVPSLGIEGLLQGTRELTVSEEWTMLPTLNANSVLANPFSPDITLEELRFGYDPELKAYGVRLNEGLPRVINLSYFVSPPLKYVPQTPIESLDLENIDITFNENGPALNPGLWSLERLVYFFQSFTQGSVAIPENAKEYEAINLLIAARTGIACAGRSRLFCLIAPLIYPHAKAILVGNKAHEYVQLNIGNHAFNIDLGGYPAQIHTENPIEATFVKAPETKGIAAPQSEGYPEYALNLLSSLKKTPKKPHALLLTRKHEPEYLHLAFIEAAKRNKMPVAHLTIEKMEIFGVSRENGRFIKTEGKASAILKNGGLILLDLSNLSASNIATLLQLTDPDHRVFGGIALNPRTKIIAFLSRDLPASPDIGRRFSIIQDVPLFPPPKSLFGDAVIANALELPSQALAVDLFNDPAAFRQKLLGTIDDKMEWSPGALIEAIKTNRPLILYNAPDVPELRNCLRELNSGVIYFKGKKIAIPRHFKVFLAKKIETLSSIEVRQGEREADFVLNPQTFPLFLRQITAEGASIRSNKGLLSQTMKEESVVLVTEDLSPWQWRQLLSLRGDWPTRAAFATPLELSSLIATNDLALSVKLLKKNHPDANFFPVPSGSASRKFMPTLANLDAKGMNFALNLGPVWESLNQGKHVFLYGDIHRPLLNELAPLLLQKEPGYYVNGMMLRMKGRLTLIHDISYGAPHLKGQELSYMPEMIEYELFQDHPSYEVNVSTHLLANANLPKSYAAIQRMIRYRQAQIENPLSYFSASGTVETLYRERVEKVLKAFEVSPILYLYGPPAGGKSHFIFETLPQHASAKFFYGEMAIEAYLSCPEDAILCLDEGDLNPELIDELMPLQESPPNFLHARKLYPLKGKKLVIITGNGQFSDREPPKFIQTYGGAIYFPKLPLTQIQKEILNPLLPDDSKAHMFSHRLVELYQMSGIELRDLKSIASTYYFYCEQESFSHLSGQELGDLAFDDIAPKAPVLHEIKIRLLDSILEKSRWNLNYILTPSRKRLLWQLYMLLKLREKNAPGMKQGFLIEGAAGEGKTALVKKAIAAFSEENPLEINMSGDPAHVAKALQEAFHQGAIVLSDEFDGTHEALHNVYMTGRDPNGLPAHKPGYFLIATANGNTYPWRRPLKAALKSRFHITQASSYTREELMTILKTLGVEEEEGALLLQEHQKLTLNAPNEILRPTAADLFEKARTPKTVSNRPDLKNRKGRKRKT